MDNKKLSVEFYKIGEKIDDIRQLLRPSAPSTNHKVPEEVQPKSEVARDSVS